jgi:hypothetical protein
MAEYRPSIPYSVRDQHIYIPGKTRHGKSTLMHRMVHQDIANGAGVTVIDPKGDFIPKLLDWIPPHRVDDVISVSLDNPVPIDWLDYKNDDEKEALVGELKYLITKGATAEHAPLMTAILTDIIYTLLLYNERQHEPSQRATFLDIHYFLSDEEKRETILSLLKDTRFYRRWKDDFPNPKDRQPTMIRMNPFINSRTMSTVFGCPNPKLNIGDVMDNRKVLLVNIGGLSEVNRMFGTLVLTKIQQATFRRYKLHERERIPHFLYVDEFQECQTSTFNQLLSMAGGYGLRLCLANQFVGQLDDIVRKSIFGNVGSYIVFCIGSDETRFFRDIALPYDHAELARFPKYRALFKIAGEPEAVIKRTLPIPTLHRPTPAEPIRTRTIAHYACPPLRNPEPALESKRDDTGPAKPFNFNQGKTRGPSRTR